MRNQSLISNLGALQEGQLHHDQSAHQDILGLPVPKRITHFALHFAKYVGALFRARREGNRPLLERVITDSFVIVLAAANAMNIDLREKIPAGKRVASRFDANRYEALVSQYAEHVGEIAKACESLDHLEDYPFRPVVEDAVVAISLTTIELASLERLDLEACIVARWQAVEQKYFLRRVGGRKVSAAA